MNKPDLLIAAPYTVEVAFKRTIASMQAIAVTTDVNEAEKTVTGYVWGIARQTILVVKHTQCGDHTQVVVTADSWDITGSALRNALRRFDDAFHNIHKKGYKGDKGGVHPALIVVVLLTSMTLLTLHLLGVIDVTKPPP